MATIKQARLTYTGGCILLTLIRIMVRGKRPKRCAVLELARTLAPEIAWGHAAAAAALQKQ